MKILTVDAFTDTSFAGNPASVCLLDQDMSREWMQAVAAEMNHSETAFIKSRSDGSFRIRWFTPSTEVLLCGHATLASAHVLWEERLVDSDEIVFDSASGPLVCRREGDMIAMDFPSRPPHTIDAPSELFEALGTTSDLVFRNIDDFLVELRSEGEVVDVKPDFARLRSIDCRGVIITARADDPDVDFVSRFFAPRIRVIEDPVTGSAHCALAPYWSQRLEKSDMLGFQASQRGGYVRVSMVDPDRVLLKGQAVTVIRGNLAESAVRYQPGEKSIPK
jgi:PhzF family phenazine biosynthesis protein